MVLNAQSNSNEDSQGRQLRVNKKLSKAISSVPRSRFQKPRPNLFGSKRTDSCLIPAGVHKSVETSQNRDEGSHSVTKTDETLQNEAKVEAAVSNAVGTSQMLENRNAAVSSTDVISETTDSCKIELTEHVISETTDSCKIEFTDETPQNLEEKNSVFLLPDQILVKETDDNTPPILSISEIFEKSDGSTVLNTDETLHTGDNQDATLLSIDEIPEKENNRNAAAVESTDKLLEKAEDRETPILIAEFLPNPPEQERNDIVTVPPIVTDRSSKYPHLTSILSKKRTEPKKEVQHKRRKKFKKGDAAPERSTMTMADLIYWNPINTDQPAKSASNTDEVPNPINEEEECVDGNIEEENICDSVPKLVISEDGQINIDQTSLIVSRNVPQPTITEVIRKDETTYSSFRKRPLTKHWSVKDTTIFYKALSLVGTDFGLMEKIFPHRTRRELKQKFKREEKFNIDLINRAMYESQLTFDAETLEDLIEHLNNLSDGVNSENVDDPGTPVKAKKRSSNKKQKTTKKNKSIDTEFCDSAIESLPNEAENKRVSSKRKRKTKKLPEDFIDIENAMEIFSEETNSCDEFLDLNSENSIERSDNADSELIEIEYVEEINSVTNVMAYEVVTSLTPVTKSNRKKCIPDIPKKNHETFLPVLLSSTNYTPE